MAQSVQTSTSTYIMTLPTPKRRTFGPASAALDKPPRAFFGDDDLDSGPATGRHSLDSAYHKNEKNTSWSSTSSSRDLDPSNAAEHGSSVGRYLDPRDPYRPKLPFRQRLHHFTWAWFSLPVATGGLSLLIYEQPYQFPGLRQAGLVFYVGTLVSTVGIWVCIVARFCVFPGDLKASVTHSREGFFLAMAFQAAANVITSTRRYVVPNGHVLLQIAFWIYVVSTLSLAIGQYSYVFRKHSFGLHAMMPTWILPIFPVMLSGTIASVVAESLPASRAVPMVVAGLTCQGLGISVTFIMYAHMIGRLMAAGLPSREDRPGLFMNVGPPAFTALALVGMARILPPSFEVAAGSWLDVSVMRDISIFAATFLWALSLWWFGIAALAVLHSWPRYFHIGWWAMVFPNTGFILATISIGNAFQSDAVRLAASVMSAFQVSIYLFVLVNHVKAVWVQEIMYPGMDEDVDDF